MAGSGLSSLQWVDSTIPFSFNIEGVSINILPSCLYHQVSLEAVDLHFPPLFLKYNWRWSISTSILP